MSKELEELITGQGEDGQDHSSMIREVATEYADSDEVKRRHWNELLNAMAAHADWLSLGPAYWETYKFDNDCDSDDLRGIVSTKDFACEAEGDWVGLFRHCRLATKENSEHWSDD